MPNLKSVRESFASLDEKTRRIIAWWNDRQTEQGYEVESGKALQEWFKRRKKGGSNDPRKIKTGTDEIHERIF